MKRAILEMELFKHKATNRITQRLSIVLAKAKPGFFAEQVKNPIFLLDCFCSGTSLLSRLLGMHHDIANWSEANQIWNSQWHPWRLTYEDLCTDTLGILDRICQYIGVEPTHFLRAMNYEQVISQNYKWEKI